ncbi:MAG: hypothetical protein N3G21_11630 [Candidatus Hydrogenedentes bacterium]|nr:hypothetical protein [Candidatus Hydrogenedentota bacterium]
MIILGISEDFFDSGITICYGDEILFMSNEERYTRRKNEGGFPYFSLDAGLRYLGISLKEISAVCVSGVFTPFPVFRIFPSIHKKAFESRRRREEKKIWSSLTEWAVNRSPISYRNPSPFVKKVVSPILRKLLVSKIPDLSEEAKISFVEHHEAHAWGAFFTSGFEKALIVTADGMGDGLSLTVSVGSSNSVNRVWQVSAKNSFGIFFENLTEIMGFVPCRDEGKLTGLSAHGDAQVVKEENPFKWDGSNIVYCGPRGRKLKLWLCNLFEKYGRENLSAWAQNILEKVICDVVKHWVSRTGINKIAVAGGVFANVLLNMRIHELPEIEELFVYPNMGDGGLSLGAICATFKFFPKPLAHAFWGDSFPEMIVLDTLCSSGLAYTKLAPNEIAPVVARAIVEGKFVGRFVGRMEWGPRALGNRSILSDCRSEEVSDKLNKMLCRSEFMPFAPAIIYEDASKFLIGYDKAEHAGEFMTTCFMTSNKLREKHKAIVHLDGTCRAQIVKKENNPAFYDVLHEYKKLSGSGVVLNTSYNIHEEPIVRTPQEAVDTFVRAGLDFLFIEDFVVAKSMKEVQQVLSYVRF